MRRIGILGSARKSVAWRGGIPAITADVRVFAPPGTATTEIREVLQRAVEDVERQLGVK